MSKNVLNEARKKFKREAIKKIIALREAKAVVGLSLLAVVFLIISGILAGFFTPGGMISATTTSQLIPMGNGNYTSWSGNYTDIDEGMASPSCLSSDSVHISTANRRESFTIDLSSIPNGSTITIIDVLVADRSYNSEKDGGTYATFIRFNGTDSANSAVHTTTYETTACSGFRDDLFSIAGAIKNDSTTLEIGIVKLGTSSPASRSVRIGAMAAIVTYTVPDTTPPTLHLPSDITIEATGPSGAVTTFVATADDTNPAHPVVICLPVSGSTFSLGQNTISCSTTDTALNTATGTFKITVQDTTPPVITLNGSSPTIIQVHNLYAEPGANVTDNYDTGLAANITGVVDKDTVGVYTVYYDVVDSHSNHAIQKTRIVNVVDQEPPSTNDNAPTGWRNSDTTITLICTDNVACSKVYYTTDSNNPTADSSYVNASSNWSFTVNTEGQYTIKYFAVDASNNQESVKTATNILKIDKSVQSVSITAPTGGAELKGTATITADGSDTLSGIKKVEFWDQSIGAKISEDTEAPYSIDWDTKTMSDGSHNIMAKVEDKAGNILDSAIISVLVDNTAPVISILTPATGSYKDPINISGSATDAAAKVKYVHLYYKVSANDAWTEIDTNNSQEGIQPISNSESAEPFAFSYLWTPSTEGIFNIGVRAEDRAGNWSGASPADIFINNVIYDITVPVITIANPDSSSAQSKTITATANEGALTQSITTGSVCDNTLTFADYVSVTFSSEADNGKKVCYKAVDEASNIAYKMSDPIAGIDTTAPVITFPADITTDTADSLGKIVTYTAPTAADSADGSVAVTCDKNSGDNFPVAITTVTCSAKDVANNTATKTFKVTVNQIQQNNGGGGGGGGYYVLPEPALVISEQSIRAPDIAPDSLTIAWTTNFKSSSYVIYSAEGETHSLDMTDSAGTPPKYGYVYATAESDISEKVTAHSVIITGLNPNKTYYFRTVSRGSLAISGEYKATTPAVAGAATVKQINIPEQIVRVVAKNVSQIKKIAETKSIIQSINQPTNATSAVKPANVNITNNEKNKPLVNTNSFTASLGAVWSKIFSFSLSNLFFIIIIIIAILLFFPPKHWFKKK